VCTAAADSFLADIFNNNGHAAAGHTSFTELENVVRILNSASVTA
jgi:hypothetical protein